MLMVLADAALTPTAEAAANAAIAVVNLFILIKSPSFRISLLIENTTTAMLSLA